jgi:hypothetical protein
MLGIYRETAVMAFKRAVKAWPVAFSLVLYAAILVATGMLVGGMGIVGGFILGLVSAACISGYLYLLSQAVQGLPLRLSDFKSSFGALFWDVISVMFALWIIGFVLEILVKGAGHNGEAIQAMIMLAMAFFLNPVPELIYQGKTRSFELLHQSARFVLANPVAWFLPNLLFAVVLLAPSGALMVEHPGLLLVTFSQVFSVGGLLAFAVKWKWAIPLLLLFLHYVMVFRGLLFQALSGDSARRRAWQAQLRR